MRKTSSVFTPQLNVIIHPCAFIQNLSEINFILAKMSTVEINKGSWMVKSFCKQLQLLDKDVDVAEFLRRMCFYLINHRAVGEAQTPQISVLPHDRTQFCKWCV